MLCSNQTHQISFLLSMGGQLTENIRTLIGFWARKMLHNKIIFWWGKVIKSTIHSVPTHEIRGTLPTNPSSSNLDFCEGNLFFSKSLKIPVPYIHDSCRFCSSSPNSTAARNAVDFPIILFC